jgi:4-aminobutyrate aminotransferase/(S)-3-amino-2-methylpropionate transaminase
MVADRARQAGTLLVLDEVFTGLGRCGAWSLGRAWGVTPDLLCIGKGLADGFPISACVGRAGVMDAWGASTGPALHTQTFLGNPVGCAMALATLDVLDREDLPSRAAAVGVRFQEALKAVPGVREVRGRGLLVGAVLQDGRTALAASRALLRRGWIVLPAGEKGDVLEYTPPLTIPTALLEAAVDVLAEVLREGV